jgi:hypothetical protein
MPKGLQGFQKGHPTYKGCEKTWIVKGSKLSADTKKKMSLVRQNPSLELRKKWSEGRKGEKNNNWKGGISPLKVSIRSLFQYRLWRSDVFLRDNFICCFCGKKGGEIHADHIKPFHLIIKENNINSIEKALLCSELWNINNGRTLCLKCHRKTKTYGNSNTSINI